ncbi:MAG: CopG family ribbon-helix-helix protein [Candidatus Thorarchaeota archaeon]
MPDDDFAELERLQKEGGFSNRSEVVRHALQSLLAEHRTMEGFVGNVTLVVTAMLAPGGKSNQCSKVQHMHNDIISAIMHAHSSEGACVEIMVIDGEADEARKFIQKIRSLKRVTRVQVSLAGR